jgi:hypothetical protein
VKGRLLVFPVLEAIWVGTALTLLIFEKMFTRLGTSDVPLLKPMNTFWSANEEVKLLLEYLKTANVFFCAIDVTRISWKEAYLNFTDFGMKK